MNDGTKRYYVQLPGYERGEIWDEDKYNRNKEQLFNDHKDAIVMETSPMTTDDAIGDGDMFTVHLPGFPQAEAWDAAKLGRNRERLLKEHPDAEIVRAKPVDFWGEKLNAINAEISQLKPRQESALANANDGATNMRTAFDDLDTASVVDAANRSQEATSELFDVQGRLDTLYRERESNPAYQSEKQAKLRAFDEATARIDGMFGQLNEANPASAKIQKDPTNLFDRTHGDSKLAEDMRFNPDYYRDYEALAAAKMFYDDARKTEKAPSKYDETTGLGNFFRGLVGEAPETLSPVALGKSIAKNTPLIKAIKDIQDAEGKNVNIAELVTQHPERMTYLSDAQKEMVKAFVVKSYTDWARSEDLSLGYQSGSTAMQSLGFMADFFLMGGMGDAAAKFATKGITNGIARASVEMGLSGAKREIVQAVPKFVEGTIQAGVKTAVMTPFMPSSYANLMDNLVRVGDSGQVDLSGKAIAKAVGDVFIENLSESAGAQVEAILGVPFRLAGKAGVGELFANTKFGAWGKAVKNSPMAKIMKQAGWNGYIGEIGEEWYGNALRVMTGVDKGALKDFATVDQQIITLTSFAPMTLFGGATSTAQYIASKKQMNEAAKVLSDVLEKNGYDERTIQNFIDVTRAENPTELANALAPAVVQAANDNADAPAVYKAVMDYAQAVARYRTFDGVSQADIEQQRQGMLDEISAQMNVTAPEGGEETPVSPWIRRRQVDAGDGNSIQVQSVRVLTDANGDELFVVGEDEDGRLAAVHRRTGAKAFISQADIDAGIITDDTGDMSLNDFLDRELVRRRQADDAQRVELEQLQNKTELMQRSQPGTVLNIGTVENPVQGTIVQFTGGKFIVQGEDGRVREYDEQEMANILEIPLTPLTQEQQETADAEEIERQDRLRDRANTMAGRNIAPVLGREGDLQLVMVHRPVMSDEGLRYQVDYSENGNITIDFFTEDQLNELLALGEQTPAVDVAEQVEPEQKDDTPRDFRGNPLPMRTNKQTGQQVVDGNALWNRDPEAWARWNDTNPNQRVGSKERLEYTLTELGKEIDKDTKAVQKAALKGIDEDEMDKMESALAVKLDRRELLQSILNKYNLPAVAGPTIAGEQRKAVAEQVKQEQLAGFPGIQQRWNTTPKVNGTTDEIRLPNGESIPGRYVLTEAEAPTASHNPANGFAMTEGFPVDENGKTVNDRDYEHDRAAQTSVTEKAANYDQRALQTPVIVSPDGVVLSGNDRTMAGQLAAANNTDAEYTGYLSKYAGKYGFSAEQVAQFRHPRVVFVPDAQMPYNAATFAKFNAEEKKSQSKTEKAVKAGKTLNAEALGALASLVDRYDDINALYNDRAGVDELLNILLSAEVISQEQLAALRDGDTLSGTGMDLLESTLIGAALDEEAVRVAMSDKSIRKSVVSAISQIITSNTLSDFTLRAELTDAITLVANGKALGEIKFGESVQDYIRQQHLFMDDVVAEATVQLLADAINDRKTSFLKKVLSLYDRDAVESANGQMNLLTGDVPGREAILRNILEYLGYDTNIIYDTSERAAEQREPAGPAEPAAGAVAQAETEQAPSPVQGSTGGPVTSKAQFDREEVAAILEQGGVSEYNLIEYMTDEEVSEFIRRWEAFLPSNDALGEAYNRLYADLHSGDKKKKKAAQAEIDRLEMAQVEAHAPVQEFVDELLAKYGEQIEEEAEADEESFDEDFDEDEEPKTKKGKKGAKNGKKEQKPLGPVVTGKHSDKELASVEYTQDEVEQLIYGGSMFGEYTSKKTGEKIEIVYADDEHPIYHDHQVRFWVWQKGAEYGDRREAVVTTDYMMRYLKLNGFKLTNPSAKKNKLGYWVNRHGVIVNPIYVELPSVHKGWAQSQSVSFAQDEKGKWVIGENYSGGPTGGGGGYAPSVNAKGKYDTKTDAIRAIISHAEAVQKRLFGGKSDNKSKSYEQRDLENLINALKTKTLPQAMLEEGVVESVMRIDLSDAGVEGVQGDLFGGEVVEETEVVAPAAKEKPKKESTGKKKTSKRKVEPGVNLFGEEIVEAPEETETATAGKKKGKKASKGKEVVVSEEDGDEAVEPKFTIEDEEGTPGNFHWVSERVCSNPQIITLPGADRLASVPKVALAEKDGKWYETTYVTADGGKGSAWGGVIPTFTSSYFPYNSREDALKKAVNYIRWLLDNPARKAAAYGQTFNETKGLIDYIVKMELPKEEAKKQESTDDALANIKKALDTFASNGNYARVVRTLEAYKDFFGEDVAQEIGTILTDMRKDGISKESKNDMVRRVAELYNGLVAPETEDETEQEPVAPAVEEKSATPAYGSQNTIVTTEKYEELKKRMMEKLGQLNAGFDPEVFFIGAQMAAYHVEAGARKFVDFAQRMIADLGDAIRPYLKAIYNGARDLPGMDGFKPEMDSAADVEGIDVDSVGIEQPVAEETPAVQEPAQPVEAEAPKKAAVQQVDVNALFGAINDMARGKREEVKLSDFAEPVQEERDTETKNSEDAFEKASDEMGRIEDQWSEKIKDYIGEHYPTQATVSARTDSPEGLSERKAMENDETLQEMLRQQKSDLDAAQQKVDDAYRRETQQETETAPATAETETLGELGKYTHTKTGKEMTIVRLTGDRLTNDEFKQLKARAKELGGYYSSYGGAKGFLFDDEADAIKFNTINAPQNAEEQTDDETAADTTAIVSQAASVAIEAQSLAEAESADEQAAAEVITRIDDALEAIDDQLALLGYYEAEHSGPFHESYGYMKSAEKKAVKDADKLARRLAQDLGIDAGRKQLAKANIAPAGGEVTFRLPLNDGRELYVCIDMVPDSEDNLFIGGVMGRKMSIMYRVEQPSASGSDKYGSNNFAPYNVKYADLLKRIRSIAKDYLPEPPAPAVQEGPVDVLQVAKEQAEKSRKSKKDSVSSQQEGDAALGGLFADLYDAQDDEPVEEVNGPAPVERVKPTEMNGFKIGEKVQYTPNSGDRKPQTATIFDFEYDGRPVLDAGLAPILYEVVDWNQVSKIEVQEPVNDTQNGSSEQPQGVSADAGGPGEEAGQEGVRADRGGEGGREGDLHGSSRTLRPRYDDSVKRNTRNNRVAKGEVVYPKTPAARYKANIAAIRLMKELQDSGKTATKEQMSVLRQFTGWGGLGGYFNNEYSPEYRELKSLLSDEEMQAAANSINTAYYTPVEVIDAMWDIAKRLGFEGGNVLEGSAGIGNIIASMPKAMSERSEITAVELDQTTGGILTLLYPDANVMVKGFQDADIANGSVDLAITNVPFGNDIKVYDAKEKDLTRKFGGGRIHDFCIAKNVRKLAPGGLGIFISTRGTLDSSSKALRQWLVNEGDADVIGAFRLNNATFEGTGATSDIIVVRKRVDGKVSPNAIDVTDTVITRREDYELDKREWNPKTRAYELVTGKAAMEINSYFAEHPENMGGEMGFGFEHDDTYRPASSALWPTEKIDQNKRLAKWVKQFSSMQAEEQAVRTETQTEAVEDSNATKEGQLVTNSKGDICVSRNGKAVPIGVNSQKVKGFSKAQVLKDYDALKTAINEVLDYQLKNESDAGLKPLLDKLNRSYDNFARRYSRLNKNTAISFLRNDVDFPSIAAVEDYREKKSIDGKVKIEVKKTSIFSGRVLGAKRVPTPKDAKDGVIVSINQFGRIDIPFIANALHKDDDVVRQEILSTGLGFENPLTGGVEVEYEYLSGNVREKLEYAREHNTDGKYDSNIKALEKVVPADIPAHLIEFSLGSDWMPVELFTDYAKEKFGVNDNFKLVQLGGTWSLAGDEWNMGVSTEQNRAAGVTSDMLNMTKRGHELMIVAMNNASAVFSRSSKDPMTGQTVTETDKAATQAATTKMSEMRDDFKEWCRAKMLDNPELAARVGKIYNDTFNAVVPKEIRDTFVPAHFEGMATKLNNGKELHLRLHQSKAVIRGTTEPLMLAHEVGTGKTFTLIATAMEMRRLGTAKKPMIVVQNATLGQFVSSAKELYPNAKILTISEADRTVEGRSAFYAKIKYNDWDMVVVPQSVFEMIPDSEERQRAFIQEKIDEKKFILEQAKEAGNATAERQLKKELEDLEYEYQFGEKPPKKGKKDAKKEAKALDNAVAKAKRQLDRKTDDVADFDEMGIDALLIDEAHAYKHLGFSTAMQRGVKGVDATGSKKSAGVYLKTRAVFDKVGWKNVIFATGTPISNTAAEIWTFMKYLMPGDKMRQNHIYYFDDFVRNFGNISQSLEFNTSGKFKENTRFASYNNLPELVRIWWSVCDTVRAEDAVAEGGEKLEDKQPKMENWTDAEGNEHVNQARDIYLPQSGSLVDIMNAVRAKLEWYENLSGKEKKENSSVPLTMFGIAKMAAIDPRLVDRDAPDEPNSKTNQAVAETLKALKDSERYKGTAAIFCDNFRRKDYDAATGRRVVGFNIFEEIKRKLVEAGVPEEQIVIIDSQSVAAKEKIFAKVNSGEIRVIMGSTQKLGTGVNIQERLFFVAHLDAPNRPMDYTQRNGRILRQGNLHREWGIPVRVVRFGVEDSLDVTAYQRLSTKSKFINSVMDGKPLLANGMDNRVLEEAEEGEFDNPVAVLSGSQYALLKSQAERELRKLRNKKEQHRQDQIYIERTLKENALRIDYDNKLIDEAKRNLEKVRAAFPDGTVKQIVIEGRKVSGPAQVGEAVKERITDPLRAHIERRRNDSGFTTEDKHYTMTFDGVPVDIKVGIDRIREFDDKTYSYKTVMRTRIEYADPSVGIDAHYIIGGMNAIREIPQEFAELFATGKYFTQAIANLEGKIARLESDDELMLKRRGQPFADEEKLQKQEEVVKEYTEKMKAEMAEKEAKYAELAKNSAGSFSVDSVEVDEDDEDDGETSAEYMDTEGNGFFSGIEDRREDEGAYDFTKRVVGSVLDKYPALKGTVVTTDSALKLSVEKQDRVPTGMYNRKTKKILIFAKENIDSADAIERSVFHEAIHMELDKLGWRKDWKLINLFNYALVGSGHYSVDEYREVFSDLKARYEDISGKKYSDRAIREEMVTYEMSEFMESGIMGAFLGWMRDDLPGLAEGIDKILNEIGYEPEKESERYDDEIFEGFRSDRLRGAQRRNAKRRAVGDAGAGQVLRDGGTPAGRGDEGTVSDNAGEGGDLEEDSVSYEFVTDPATIERLESGDKETGYRNVVLNKDGSMGSPMAGKLGRKGRKSVPTSPFTFDKWEQAEENPDMATEDGKINLGKPDNLGSVDGVDYNPYIHIRPSLINRQFTGAWKRKNLVFIETLYPTSELTSGYHAEKAVKSVGRHAWNGGDLILSRWDKPVRVVPWETVADDWQKEFSATGVTFDIVPPGLLDILASRGVEILPPKKAAGAPARRAYNEWRDNRGPDNDGGLRETARDLYDRYENQNGEDKPWLSEGEFISLVERELPRNSETTGLFNMIDGYHALAEEDFDEGRRDYAGGQMKDLFDDFLSALKAFGNNGPVRNRVAANSGRDAEYMAAVEAGDMNKVRNMVADAAAVAMPYTKVTDEDGKPMVMYHGTHSAGFTVFKPRINGHTIGWFTSSKVDADSYAGNPDGKVFRSEEKADNDVLKAGSFPLGKHFMFDSQEDLDEFVRRHPGAESYMSEREIDDAMYEVETDAEEQELRRKRDESKKIRQDYWRYERGHFVTTSIGDILANPDAYTLNDIKRAWLAIDGNASFDDTDELEPDEQKAALVEYLGDYVQEQENEGDDGIREMTFESRVPRGGEGVRASDLNRRTYAGYINMTNPYVVDAGGRHSEFESGDIYKLVGEVFDNDDYDGVLIKNWRVGRYQRLSDVAVPKKSSQVKSANPVTYDGEGNVIPLSERFNPASGDIRFRTAGVEMFISNAESAVNAIQMEKATPQQWLKMIEGKGGLKAGEDKWIGLSDWLNASDRKTLTKQEVLDYIAQNRIQIEEQDYAEEVDVMKLAEEDVRERIANGKSIEELQAEVDELKESDEYNELEDEDEQDEWLNGQMVDRYGDDFETGYWIVEGEIDYNIDTFSLEEDEFFRDYNGTRKINSTRLDYTTKGLENKREIALTVPTIQPWNEHDNVHFGDAGEGRAIAWVRFGDTYTWNELGRLREAVGEAQHAVETSIPGMGNAREELEQAEKALSDYQSEHPDKKNGTDRVLVIDEIQSKRHQEGREVGYKTPLSKEALEEIENARTMANHRHLLEQEAHKKLMDALQPYKDRYNNDEITAEEYDKAVASPEIVAVNEEYKRLFVESQQAHDELTRVLSKYNMVGVPPAPFEKNWHELAMKRMLRLAAEEGYDYVAWTTGEQQARRYNDLGKVLDYITRNEDKKGNKEFELSFTGDWVLPEILRVDDNGKVVYSKSGEFDGKSLGEIVGKEMAVKMMRMEVDEDIEGEDLFVGGEGMKGFYDDILPRFMNKYGKKWGVKVEDIELPRMAGTYAHTMHAVRITPEMKESVMQGQLMFRSGEQSEPSPVAYNESTGAKRLSASETARKFGVDIEFRPSSQMMFNGKPLAGRWMDGKMYVCLEHCRDNDDAVRTVLHEGVGHNGLRRLIGNDNMREFCLDLFRSLPKAVRNKIANDAVTKYGGNIVESVERFTANDVIREVGREAMFESTEEWLAETSETIDYDEYRRNVWDIIRDALRRVLAKVGINVPLSMRDVKWLMVQSAVANHETDPLVEARRQVVAKALGFTLRQQAEKYEAVQLARNRIADQTLAPAARIYNKDVLYWLNRLRETWIDKDNAVHQLVNAIEKATGKAAKSFEDVRLALNQQSSKGLAAIEKFEREYWVPMQAAIRSLMDERGCDLHEIERYVMLKHGLERNEVFAKRDAREFYRDLHDNAVKAIENSDKLDDFTKKDLVAKEDAKLDKHLAAIDAGSDAKYLELRRQDYGGLTAMYSEYDPIEPFMEGVESEEEYQARVLQARHPKFTYMDEDGREQVDMAATEDAAQKEVDGFENGHDEAVKELWKRINGATKHTLKHQYDANMMSREQYNAVSGMFKYYVPLRGFADNTAEDMYDYYQSDQRKDFTPPLLKAKGRKTEAESPFGYIGSMASSGIAADMKNETKLALYYFVSNRADNDLVTISEVWYKNTGVDEFGRRIFTPVYPPFKEDLSSDEAKRAYEEWEKQMQDEAKAGFAFKGGRKLNLKGSVIHIDDSQKTSHVIKFKVGGRDMMMYINGNPRAAQAINNELNVEMSTDYQKVFGKILRWFSGINTSYNPEFWLSNAQRDALFALMSVSVKEDERYNEAFRKNFGSLLLRTLAPGAKGGAYSLKKKLDRGELGDERLDRLYKEFVENGGVTGYTTLKNNEEWELELRKYTGDQKKAMQAVKGAFEKVQAFGEAIEQMTRFAAYMTSRDSGKDIKESVNDAKELTVNFNRKGSGKAISFKEAGRLRTKDGKKLTPLQKAFVVGASWLPVYGRRFIMFFNASTQGLNAMYRLFRKDGRKMGLWTAGYLALGVVQALLHAMLDDDDDYLDIPDYERRNNLLLGGGGTYFKWALPQEARVFYALGDMIVNHAMGREPHRSILAEVLASASDIAPLNPAGGISALAPSAVVPVVEVALNRDYKGSKIFNDLRYLSDEERKRTPKFQTAYQGTGRVYVLLSQFANWLSGGDYADAGWLNINPAAVEHILQGATGGAGTTLGKFYRGTIGQALGEDFSVRNTPFLSRILTVNDERYRNVHTTELFDYYKAEAEHTKKLINTYRKNGDGDKLDRIFESEDYEIMNIYDSYRSLLNYFNDELKVTTDRKERKALMREQDAVRKEMIQEISNIK